MPLKFSFQLKEDEARAKSSSENEKEDEDGNFWARKSNISLLDQHSELKKMAEGVYYTTQ